MFARDVHVLLTVVTAVLLVAAVVDGGIRLVRARPPGKATAWTRSALLLAVATTGASGLALLAGGHRPGEWLHVVYAALVFGLVPVADHAATALRSDRGKALARVGGTLVAAVVLVRLFATG